MRTEETAQEPLIGPMLHVEDARGQILATARIPDDVDPAFQWHLANDDGSVTAVVTDKNTGRTVTAARWPKRWRPETPLRFHVVKHG